MKFSVWPLAALLFACVAAAPPAAAQTVVTLYNQYNAPQFVAVDANRTVFVTDTTYSLSALGLENGTYAATPIAYDTNFATLYVSPEGVAVGPDGHIFSVSMSSSVPDIFFLWEFGPPDYHEISRRELAGQRRRCERRCDRFPRQFLRRRYQRDRDRHICAGLRRCHFVQCRPKRYRPPVRHCVRQPRQPLRDETGYPARARSWNTRRLAASRCSTRSPAATCSSPPAWRSTRAAISTSPIAPPTR